MVQFSIKTAGPMEGLDLLVKNGDPQPQPADLYDWSKLIVVRTIPVSPASLPPTSPPHSPPDTSSPLPFYLRLAPSPPSRPHPLRFSLLLFRPLAYPPLSPCPSSPIAEQTTAHAHSRSFTTIVPNRARLPALTSDPDVVFVLQAPPPPPPSRRLSAIQASGGDRSDGERGG